MLQKFSRVKNLGVFSDYTWDGQLPAFQRFNLIYGDNGTGKTTLSRLFGCLEVGSHEEYGQLEYKVETETGDIVQGRPGARQIRVFNTDYVQLNIGPADGLLKPILVIGEENKALAEALAEEDREINRRKLVVSQCDEAIEALNASRGKIFTAIAKTISEATSGSSVRNYRKNNAEAAFGELKAKLTLSKSELDMRRTTLRQPMMELVAPLSSLAIAVDDKMVFPSEAITSLLREASELCARSALSEAIQRLRDNPDIAAWVETGRAIHVSHGSSNCEYCGQSVPEERLKSLEAHFSAEDQALKCAIERCDRAFGTLGDALMEVSLPDRMAFYTDIRENYLLASKAWDDERSAILAVISDIRARLREKQTARTEALPFDFQLDPTELEKKYTNVAAFIDEQNERTTSFDKAYANARGEIERHYLTSVVADVADFDEKIERQRQQKTLAEDGSDAENVSSLPQLIATAAEKRAQISSSHQAGDRLTKMLHTFLGRSELVFYSGDDGYRVLRNGRAAKRLSEGERTAVAFIYFIVQLQDQDFDMPNGVVVIDDPVSSLDASSVYQAFSFLKNSVRDAKQVFVLTHNFGFLRLLINWLQGVPNSEGRKAYFMIMSQADATARTSRIVKLDSALVDHPTEYHYLFKILTQFQGDGTISGCYHIPNVVRKVLETFLDFYAPAPKSLYAKLNSVPFDETKKTAIYKFSNDLSHFTGQGFEPGLVQESQKNTGHLLEMIKALAPEHYNGMIDSIS